MTLVAHASKTVRLKNAIIVLMCLVFFVLFFRDGYFTYPANNDYTVRKLLDSPAVSASTTLLAQEWLKNGGWNSVPAATHEKMDAAIKSEAAHFNSEGWKGPFDVNLQRILAWGLLGCLIASLWWFIHCQRRRAIAQDATVSPARGIVIPWEKITRVDNARWKTVGIVDITYTDDQGQTKTANFDDYKLQREPLLPILDQLAEKAVHAEFLPKEEPKPEPQPEPNEQSKEDPNTPPPNAPHP